MTGILDSYAVLAYLEKEPGYEKVRDLFVKAAESGTNLLMSTVNWGEVYYIIAREQGQDKAEEIKKILATFPIDLVPVDQDLAQQAALFKAFNRLSYADCFAAALAKTRSGELITGDQEFRNLEKEIRVFWI